MGIFDNIFKKKQDSNGWPNDADGDVLRRMKGSGFDFSKTYSIDFNIDLQEWPPNQNMIKSLKSEYGEIQVHKPSEDYEGYLVFQIVDKVTYEVVMKIQKQATQIVEKYGGVCESWGVMQD